MKKEKIYKFNSVGFAQLRLDLRQAKVNRLSNVMYIVMVIGLFGLGVLSKEMLILLLGNSAVNKVSGVIIH